jgi:arylsulfatase A-like enzyme
MHSIRRSLPGTLDGTLLLGVCVGVLDALWTFRGGARLPRSIWFFVPLVWIVFLVAVRLIFTFPPIERFAKAAGALSGPGLLILSRGGPLLKNVASLSLTVTTFVCLILVVAAYLGLARTITTWPRVHNWGWFSVGVWMLGCSIFIDVPLTPTSPVKNRPVAEPRAPNVMLIFLDTVRQDDSLQMHNLADFSSRAVVFDNAWAPASWTLPSHLAVLTGRDPWKVRSDTRSEELALGSFTLAQRFATHGYRTSAVFANYMLRPQFGFSQGFDHFEWSQSSPACQSGLAFLVVRASIAAGKKSSVCAWMTASDVTRRALTLVDQSGGPFFIVLNYMDAHEPYYVEPRCIGNDFQRYSAADHNRLAEATRHGSPLPQAAAARIHSQYRAAIRCMDVALGPLLDEVERKRNGRDTVVAIVGDHGEQFGAHGLAQHGNSVYRQVLHVPLIVRSRDQVPRHIAFPVTATDLYSTLARIVDPSERRGGLFGNDRRTVVAGSDIPVGLPFGGTSVLSVVQDRYQLIRWKDGREELYDYVQDGAEKAPARDTSGEAQLLENLRGVLRQSFDQQQFEGGATDPSAWRSLGYLQ